MTETRKYFRLDGSLFKQIGLVLAMALGLAACGEQDAGGPGAQSEPTTTKAVVALSAENQELYDISCKVCHEQAASGAPLTGKVADWQARETKDLAGVLNNVLNGYGNMPAMGGCFNCSDEQFEAMIGHMSAGVVK